MRKFRANEHGFSFIVPMTLAIVVGFAVMAIGGYVVGEIDTSLENTFPSNTESGSTSTDYWNNWTTNDSRNVSLPTYCDAGQLDGTSSNFYIQNNATESVYYNLSVNGNWVNTTSLLAIDEGYNWTLTALIAASAVSSGDTYLNYSWDVNATETAHNTVTTGNYYLPSDYASANQNGTISLLGNITSGFSDVVDIEIVVIIITALSMAIFAVMAVGSKKGLL